MSEQRRISVYVVNPTDSPYFYAQWISPATGLRRTRSLRTADPKVAERRRQKLEDDLNRGADVDLTRTNWASFTDRFVTERLGGVSEGARRNARRILERFGKAHHPSGPRSVTADLLSRHVGRLRAEGLAEKTVQVHATQLGTALRWAAEVGMIEVAPKVPRIKPPRKRTIRTLPAARFPDLLALCPSEDWRLFCRVAWHTGMRLGELFHLRWQEGEGPWLDLTAARVRFPAEWCKGRRDDWLPLHPELLALLRAECAGKSGAVFALERDTKRLSAAFNRMAMPLGVKTHDLRRTFGTRYAPLVPAHVLQRLMRHQDIKTTLEYYADLDPTLEAAIALA